MQSNNEGQSYKDKVKAWESESGQTQDQAAEETLENLILDQDAASDLLRKDYEINRLERALMVSEKQGKEAIERLEQSTLESIASLQRVVQSLKSASESGAEKIENSVSSVSSGLRQSLSEHKAHFEVSQKKLHDLLSEFKSQSQSLLRQSQEQSQRQLSEWQTQSQKMSEYNQSQIVSQARLLQETIAAVGGDVRNNLIPELTGSLYSGMEDATAQANGIIEGAIQEYEKKARRFFTFTAWREWVWWSAIAVASAAAVTVFWKLNKIEEKLGDAARYDDAVYNLLADVYNQGVEIKKNTAPRPRGQAQSSKQNKQDVSPGVPSQAGGAPGDGAGSPNLSGDR